MPQYLEAAFAPNPQRVKSHIPKYRSMGSGRDFYIRNSQCRTVNTIPMTADVYRAGTFRRPKRRTKELNFPSRPPRYKMDGSGRDGFVFLHGDVGKPKARVFRTNTTPWGAKSTAPWAHDPRLRIVAKCASLRRRPNSRGTKLVAPRQQRPHSAVRATLTCHVFGIDSMFERKCRILISKVYACCC